MSNKLEGLRFYQKSNELFELCWDDCAELAKDFRGKEIARQLIRSCGSISANIEEGYGRGEGKQYIQHLRISRGSAQESRGWYLRSSKLLSKDALDQRSEQLNEIIAMISSSILTLEGRISSKE